VQNNAPLVSEFVRNFQAAVKRQLGFKNLLFSAVGEIKNVTLAANQKWHREPGLISVQGMPVACQAPQIEMLEFSPVVPVYNEQEVLPTLCGAVRQALESRVRGSWEVIFVHDGSEDGTAPPLVLAVGKIPIFLNHSKYSSAYISLIILFLINNAFAHG